MTAWHGRPELKAEVMDRLRAHRAADEIVQGLYQQSDPDSPNGYRGCAIGCTLPKQSTAERDALNGDGAWKTFGWHKRIEAEYGIPIYVAQMIDRTFEGLPVSMAGDFAVTVADAIPVGADLSGASSECDHYPRFYNSTMRAAWLIELLSNAPVPVPA